MKQTYPTAVAGIVNLDYYGLNRFLAKSNEDKVSPPAGGPGYDTLSGKYSREKNEKGQRPQKYKNKCIQCSKQGTD